VRKVATKPSLELKGESVYNPVMVDTNAPGPAGWQESLARSKEQIAAGERVPLLPVLDRLRASAERLEAEQGITADGVKVTADS